MADLSDLQAAGSTKIVGSDATGLETNPAKVSGTQDLGTADIADSSAISTTLSVGTSAVAARVGGSNLANRKLLLIQVQTANIVYGFSNSSQTYTLSNGSTMSLAIGPNITLWLRRTSGSGNVQVTELA